MNNELCNVQHRFTTGAPMWRVAPNDACAAQRPAADAWKCLVGEYAMPFMRVRTMPLIFDSDLWQAMQDGISDPSPPKLNATQTAWVEHRVAQVNDSVIADAPPAAFVASCLWHVMAVDSDNMYATLSVGGVPLSIAIARFLNGENPNLVDSCSGVACNPTCVPAGAQRKTTQALAGAARTLSALAQ